MHLAQSHDDTSNITQHTYLIIVEQKSHLEFTHLANLAIAKFEKIYRCSRCNFTLTPVDYLPPIMEVEIIHHH